MKECLLPYLPIEVLHYFFGFLSGRDLHSCTHARHSWFLRLNNEILWKQICSKERIPVDDDAPVHNTSVCKKLVPNKYLRSFIDYYRVRYNWRQQIYTPWVCYTDKGIRYKRETITEIDCDGSTLVAGFEITGNIRIWDIREEPVLRHMFNIANCNYCIKPVLYKGLLFLGLQRVIYVYQIPDTFPNANRKALCCAPKLLYEKPIRFHALSTPVFCVSEDILAVINIPVIEVLDAMSGDVRYSFPIPENLYHSDIELMVNGGRLFAVYMTRQWRTVVKVKIFSSKFVK